MEEIIRYFNIKEDIDLIYLLLKVLGATILLMLVASYLPKIKKLVYSFFIFSEPTIDEFAVNVSDSANGKNIEIYWNVKGAYNLELKPIIVNTDILNSVKIISKGYISKLFSPFLFKNSSLKSRFLNYEQRHNNLNLLNSKLSLPVGTYRLYTENLDLKLSLKAKGIWGSKESKITISSSALNDNKITKQEKPSINSIENKDLEQLIARIFINNLNESISIKSEKLINNIRTPQFQKKYLLSKNKTFNSLSNINKQIINPSNNLLCKAKKIQVNQHLNANDFRQIFLNYRENLLQTHNFDN
jgi:hypothetical protein